jgi:hypothetical protein
MKSAGGFIFRDTAADNQTACNEKVNLSSWSYVLYELLAITTPSVT